MGVYGMRGIGVSRHRYLEGMVIGFLGALAVAFIVFKLTGHIDWSWWWVTLPIWGPLSIFVALLAAAGAGVMIAYRIR